MIVHKIKSIFFSVDIEVQAEYITPHTSLDTSNGLKSSSSARGGGKVERGMRRYSRTGLAGKILSDELERQANMTEPAELGNSFKYIWLG